MTAMFARPLKKKLNSIGSKGLIVATYTPIVLYIYYSMIKCAVKHTVRERLST